MRNQSIFNYKADEFIRDNYSFLTDEALANGLNKFGFAVGPYAVMRHRQALGLKRTNEKDYSEASEPSQNEIYRYYSYLYPNFVSVDEAVKDAKARNVSYGQWEAKRYLKAFSIVCMKNHF